MINASAVNTLNQVPLVNSTQIITQSAQVPQVSQIPVAASTPIVSQVPVAASTPIVSKVPVATAPQPMVSALPPVTGSHFGTDNYQTLVDEDYRMGRGILDEFRPTQYLAQLGLVANNTVVNSTVPVTAAPLVSTPVATSAVVPTGGANVLKEFL